MTIIRRFECALAATKDKVLALYDKNPNYPPKALCKAAGFQFYNTSRFTLGELCNDPDHLAPDFISYIEGFFSNVQEILLSEARGLDFGKQITKMDKNNCLLAVVKAFSELDLDPQTIDNVKMGYTFEDLIRRFSENAEAGDHYTGRDIIKMMVNILLSEGCDDIFDDGKIKATNFVQEKTKEYKVSDLTAQPVVKLPTADTVSLAPAKEERLSQIIAEINSRTGKNYDNNVAVKAMLQIKDIMMKSDKLKTSAKNNSEKDFEFAYFNNIDDALIEGLDQNQDFFTLLLDNEELKKEVLGIFADEIYQHLRQE